MDTKDSSSGTHEPRLLRTLTSDLERVFSDVRKRGVRREVGGTLTDLETFYLSEDARRRLAKMRVLPRLAHRLWWLIKSLLMKLTPARRVLLAVGLVLLAISAQQIRSGGGPAIFEYWQFGAVLLLFVLMLELKDKLVARSELEAGRTVQLALMPERSPAVPGWDVWMFTEPANDVGGDLVDHLQIDETRHAVALGDVAGKALPAALLMVKLQATLRALVPQFGTLAELGARVNRILERDGLRDRFATLVYLVLTAGSGEVRLLNAGHPPPLVVRDGAIEELPRGSIALGIVPDAPFSEQRVELAEGDALIVYSDGITEAMDESGEFFGEDRLRIAVQQAAGQPAAVTGERVLTALAAFVGDTRTHDDVSLVVARRPRSAV